MRRENNNEFVGSVSSAAPYESNFDERDEDTLGGAPATVSIRDWERFKEMTRRIESPQTEITQEPEDLSVPLLDERFYQPRGEEPASVEVPYETPDEDSDALLPARREQLLDYSLDDFETKVLRAIVVAEDKRKSVRPTIAMGSNATAPPARPAEQPVAPPVSPSRQRSARVVETQQIDHDAEEVVEPATNYVTHATELLESEIRKAKSRPKQRRPASEDEEQGYEPPARQPQPRPVAEATNVDLKTSKQQRPIRVVEKVDEPPRKRKPAEPNAEGENFLTKLRDKAVVAAFITGLQLRMKRYREEEEYRKKVQKGAGISTVSAVALGAVWFGMLSNDEEAGGPEATAAALPEGPAAIEQIEYGVIPEPLVDFPFKSAELDVSATTAWKVKFESTNTINTLSDTEATDLFVASALLPVDWNFDLPITGDEASAVIVSEPDAGGVRTVKIDYSKINVDGLVDMENADINAPKYFSLSSGEIAGTFEETGVTPTTSDIEAILATYEANAPIMTNDLVAQGLTLAESGDNMLALKQEVFDIILQYYGIDKDDDKYRIETTGDPAFGSAEEFKKTLEKPNDGTVVSLKPESSTLDIVEEKTNGEE